MQASCCHSSFQSTYCNHHVTNSKGTSWFKLVKNEISCFVYSRQYFSCCLNSQVCKGNGCRKQPGWWSGSKGWIMQCTHCNIVFVNRQDLFWRWRKGFCCFITHRLRTSCFFSWWRRWECELECINFIRTSRALGSTESWDIGCINSWGRLNCNNTALG